MAEDVSNKVPTKPVAGTAAKKPERFGPSEEAALAGAEVQAYYTVKQISMRWQCSTKHVRRSIESDTDAKMIRDLDAKATKED